MYSIVLVYLTTKTKPIEYIYQDTDVVEFPVQVWAWGCGAAGQLGVGDAENRSVPTRVWGVWGEGGAGEERPAVC